MWVTLVEEEAEAWRDGSGEEEEEAQEGVEERERRGIRSAKTEARVAVVEEEVQDTIPIMEVQEDQGL